MSFSEDVISDCLVIRQCETGYRFGLDALLLATDLPDFIGLNARLIELGAAHGPVCLSIAMRMPNVCVTAVELQKSLFELLQYNAHHQRIALDNVECLQADVRSIKKVLPAHHFAMVVFNPPYFPIRQRRPSKNIERAIARHEVEGTLGDFLRAGQYLLHPRGWCKFVIPPWRLHDMWDALSHLDFGVVSMRFIYADMQQEAYLVEVVLRRNAKVDMVVRQPLYVRHEDGFYSEEVCFRIASAAQLEPSESLLNEIYQGSLAC